MQPRIHDSDPTRSGRAPVSDVRSRSSTTARIVIPIRVRRSRIRSPIAMSTAQTIVMNRCHDTKTPRTWKPLKVPKNEGTFLLTPGSHTACAIPMQPTSNPIVTTSVAASGAPSSGRIRNRSRTMPVSGAQTRRTNASTTRVGQWSATWSCQ